MTTTPDLTRDERNLVEAMAEAGALPGRPYRNCSPLLDAVVAHGGRDRQRAFPTMVALCRVSEVRVPLVDEHGNFGGPGYGPARPEHLEARLTLAGHLAATSAASRTVIALVNGDEHVGGTRSGHDPASVLDAIEDRLDAGGAGDAAPGEASTGTAELGASIAEVVRVHHDELATGGLELLRTAFAAARRRR